MILLVLEHVKRFTSFGFAAWGPSWRSFVLRQGRHERYGYERSGSSESHHRHGWQSFGSWQGWTTCGNGEPWAIRYHKSIISQTLCFSLEYLHQGEQHRNHRNGEPWRASSGIGRQACHLMWTISINMSFFEVVFLYQRTRGLDNLDTVGASVVGKAATVGESLDHCWNLSYKLDQYCHPYCIHPSHLLSFSSTPFIHPSIVHHPIFHSLSSHIITMVILYLPVQAEREGASGCGLSMTPNAPAGVLGWHTFPPMEFLAEDQFIPSALACSIMTIHWYLCPFKLVECFIFTSIQIHYSRIWKTMMLYNEILVIV